MHTFLLFFPFSSPPAGVEAPPPAPHARYARLQSALASPPFTAGASVPTVNGGLYKARDIGKSKSTRHWFRRVSHETIIAALGPCGLPDGGRGTALGGHK